VYIFKIYTFVPADLVPSPNRFTPLRKLPPNDGVVLVVVPAGVVVTVTVAGRFAENLKADGCRTKINSLFIR
jgi:hypothetical protein